MGKNELIVSNTKAKTHSEWAASKSSIWMNCFGSIRETRKLAPEERQGSSRAADQGTAAHHLLETCLDLGNHADDFLGHIVYVFADGNCEMSQTKLKVKYQNQFIVDEDMVDSVQICIDYVRRRIKELGPGTRMHLEARCTPFEEIPTMYGTGDVILSLWPDILEVIDYKHGFGHVDHIRNTQMRYYALGAARAEDLSHSEVITTIVQPRCHGHDPIRSERFQMVALRKWGDTLWKAFKATQEKNAPLTPGSHCTWCEVARANKCEALRNKSFAAAKADWDEDEKKSLPVPHAEADVARALEKAPMVEAWLKGVRAAAYELARRGKLPGFKVVAKKSNRKFREDMSEIELTKALQKSFQIRVLDMYEEPDLKSVAQMEKLLSGADKKKLNKRFVIKDIGGPTLVANIDSRPALTFDEASDYDEVGLDE